MVNKKSGTGAAGAGSDGNEAPEVTGFALPPEVIPLSEARGARKTSIRDCLAKLEKDGPEDFSDDVLQKLANSLGALTAAIADLDPDLETKGLLATADALTSFEVAQGDARRALGLWEKLKGKEAPLTGLLDRLERLATSVPAYEDPQAKAWKSLEKSYVATLELATTLADGISAGRVRMTKTVAKVKPAHEKLLKTPPEDRGEDAENALNALRAARDSIERRVHALRGAHNRSKSLLAAARDLAAAHQELRRQRKLIDMRALPKWEETVAELIQTAGQGAPDGSDVELDVLRDSNKNLGEMFREAAQAGDTLHEQYASAQSAMQNSK